jgi:hypothetical protein
METNRFSFFKSPINNTHPYSEVTLVDIYNYIKGDSAAQNTQSLRKIIDKKQAQKFKCYNFDYCTFSGVFSERKDKHLVEHSNLLCIDFDGLYSYECDTARNEQNAMSVELLRYKLLQDEYFETMLLFRSPSGNGLKWVIPIEVRDTKSAFYASHLDYFQAVEKYIRQTYRIQIDTSGKDVSRACYLPHDQSVFINPLLLEP